MSVQGGFGVLLKINTGSLTTIVGLVDVDFPKFVKFLAESTSHSATSGYYTAVATGKRRLEGFEGTLAWDDTEATHAAIVTAFAADTASGMSIQDPDGQEVIAFSAHIEALERVAKQEELYTCKVMFHPTGAPTIT